MNNYVIVYGLSFYNIYINFIDMVIELEGDKVMFLLQLLICWKKIFQNEFLSFGIL